MNLRCLHFNHFKEHEKNLQNCLRPWWDSNPQSSAPEADALSIRPQGHHQNTILISNLNLYISFLSHFISKLSNVLNHQYIVREKYFLECKYYIFFDTQNRKGLFRKTSESYETLSDILYQLNVIPNFSDPPNADRAYRNCVTFHLVKGLSPRVIIYNIFYYLCVKTSFHMANIW